jgi:hypothetical protein
VTGRTERLPTPADAYDYFLFERALYSTSFGLRIGGQTLASELHADRAAFRHLTPLRLGDGSFFAHATATLSDGRRVDVRFATVVVGPVMQKMSLYSVPGTTIRDADVGALVARLATRMRQSVRSTSR